MTRTPFDLVQGAGRAATERLPLWTPTADQKRSASWPLRSRAARVGMFSGDPAVIASARRLRRHALGACGTAHKQLARLCLQLLKRVAKALSDFWSVYLPLTLRGLGQLIAKW